MSDPYKTKSFSPSSFGQRYKRIHSGSGRDTVEFEIKKPSNSNKELTILSKEVERFQKLSHPNLQKISKVVEETSKWLVTCLFPKNNRLETVIGARMVGQWKESSLRYVARQILEVLHFLWKENFLHGDIHRNSVIINYQRSPVKVCITRFYLHPQGYPMEKLVQSGKISVHLASFVAPELLFEKAYSSASDIWSIGVLLYYMVSGKLLYEFPSVVSVDTSTLRVSYSSPWSFPPEFDKISAQGKTFIAKVLSLNPRMRGKYPELLHHEWLQQE